MLADMDSDVFDIVLWPDVESQIDAQEFELEPLPLSDEGLPL